MKVTRRWNGRIINKWGIVHCHVCWRVYFIPLVGVFIHFAATLSFTFGITIAVEQLCNYVYDCICNYVIHIITYTHINYYIQLCDTFKPPISTGVLVVPGGTLILLKYRKAADGQDNFSESERERERNLELLAQCDVQGFCEFCECRQRFLYEPWHAVPPVSPWHIIGQESKQ